MPLLEKIPGGEGKAQPQDLNLVPSDVSVALKDVPESGRKPQENGIREPTLISFISERWVRSVMHRRPYEQLWLQSHRNYRGLYGPDASFSSTEKSRVFIRITKTKVNAAYGQLMDVLFSDNKFPLSIDPQNIPEGVKDDESIETNPQFAQLYNDKQGQQPQTKVGYPGDGTRESETASTVAEQAFLGGPLRQNESMHDGPPQTPTAVEFNPALLSAKKMEMKIQDQLRMSNADKHLRHAAFECVNLGTGCIKGPIAVSDIIAEIDENGKEIPKPVKVPKIEAVSIWNLYTDPDARCVEDSDYIIQRHKLSMSQLRGLKLRPGFRPNEINALIAGGYNYLRQWWEPMLQDMPMTQPVEKFEVLEYWGMIDKALLLEFGLTENDLPDEFKKLDEIPCNIWVSGHHIVRLIFNPFNNGRWPYYMVPYELQPYTIWGIGISETMADTQMLMNGFMRLAIDNAVLSGNMVFEVDESSLVPGQNYTLYPGKFFRKMGGVQGQSIYAHDFPNTAQANIQLYDKARALADESTFPSYTHGNNDISPSLGRTSSGLSMMMGAASVGIRSAIKNFDDYLLAPLGEALFEFNKLESNDPELKGNFIINAGGTDALIREEVKSQRLISYIQLLQNPMLAPFGKWPYLLRETAKTMGLNPDKATNTNEEAQRMALLMQSMMPQPQPGQDDQQHPQKGKQQKGSPTNPKSPITGNPSAGQVNMPGNSSFTANKGPSPAQHAKPGRGVS